MKHALGGRNQADGNGRRARGAGDGSRAVVCRAAAGDVEYRDVNAASGSGTAAWAVNLIDESLQKSDDGDCASAKGKGVGDIDDRDGYDGIAGGDEGSALLFYLIGRGEDGIRLSEHVLSLPWTRV